jgi:gamma-glutamylcyclotransferase (GGCT)/AIG2-like uncharacterized protein YtfP
MWLLGFLLRCLGELYHVSSEVIYRLDYLEKRDTRREIMFGTYGREANEKKPSLATMESAL